MNRINLNHLTLALLTLLFAGCSSNSPNDSQSTTNEISIKAQVWQVMQASAPRRATTYDGGTLTSGSFTCTIYSANTTTKNTSEITTNPDQVNWNASTWGFAHGPYHWPASGDLDFFAYMPAEKPSYITAGPTYTTPRQPQFTCTLPMTSEGQGNDLKEFIYALTTEQNKTNAAAGVNLTFKRPFARINFQLAANHPAIRINSITFKGLKSGGTCSFDGNTSTWSSLTPDASTVNFVATINSNFATNASVQAIGTTYLMVPQTWTGQIEVNASWNDWGDTPVEHTITATLPAEKRAWAAGTSYTYTFTITETDLTVNVAKFTEQW